MPLGIRRVMSAIRRTGCALSAHQTDLLMCILSPVYTQTAQQEKKRKKKRKTPYSDSASDRSLAARGDEDIENTQNEQHADDTVVDVVKLRMFVLIVEVHAHHVHEHHA